MNWDALIGGIRVHFGRGRLAELGRVAREATGAEAGVVLLVTDPGVVRAGHTTSAIHSLEGAGFSVTLFTEVEPNPTTEHVAAGAAAARSIDPVLLVGLGGGSAMDVTKGINFLHTQGGRMEDYQGKGRAQEPMLPSVGVPTTAGTGSEAQSFALISQAETHVKMACGDEKARFRAVLLDPALPATAPRRIAAQAGLDAVSHAVESHVSKAANPVSRVWSKEAWRRLERSLPHLLAEDGDADMEHQGDALVGAHFAGAAIEQSMLGAAHALANPLTARFGLDHGTAVCLGLPHVVRFNGTEARDRYRELADVAGLTGSDPAEAVAARIEELRFLGGLPQTLTQAGVPDDAPLDELARDAGEQWTGTFNPRPLQPTDFSRLYELAR